ncbi:MAG: 3-dehydroquinate synthase [Gemmatimonadetes bacterium]|nr:3-dehydroquinate synthase [Gemmatimonadota bacterium]NIQ53879.1 3-dehydroquinate synthase [Gemmatimonadota bacterium]NIU74048.1 3-dehydroquinate synthase [Gammaproteobacteria bacterium]NIX44108.1 3-dehydroquinate synthase [Gemmatimonadota bacterium]NIY08342.1 3-dehydroquinate synthase [Gemmatimonadota bacterium]
MTEGERNGDTRLTLSVEPMGSSTEIVVQRGVLARLPELLEEHAPAPAYAVVSDDTVAGLHGGAVSEALEAAGRVTQLFRFPAGETSKSTDTWARLVESFGEMALGRDGCVVAVGGGVTGDLAGFAAATYARGIPLVQVPTSLLAMIDASIGGKTGVDLRAGKNLAGAFHHPRLVVIDPETLETLPDEELRTGLAEAVKHGVIADADYAASLHRDATGILGREPAAIDRLVAGSVAIKTAVVGRDAQETGERAVLNFGHTIGHGVERATGYAVPHGHAVAMGMVAEARIGEEVGITAVGTSDRIVAILEALRLPTALPTHLSPDALIRAAGSDKKAREGVVRYALVDRIGLPARDADGSWTHAVPEPAVRAALGPGNGMSGAV